MTTAQILLLILGILTFDFILDQVLDFINLKHSKKSIPDALKDVYEEEAHKKSLAYQKTNTYFGFLTASFSFILTFLFFAFGFFGDLYTYLNASFANPILLALIFFGVIYLASDLISLPFSIYKTFVIETQFGFNKTTPKLFAIDKIKGYVLTTIIGGGILALFLFLVLYIGKDFWIWFWIFSSAFLLLVNVFYTSLIVPLFNKLTPLEEGELREAIEKYSQKARFELSNIMVIDGSKRSTKANAFFSGLGKRKKVVFYDTLLKNHSTEEIVGVLAHEVGHYKKKHIITGLLISIVQIGVILFILSRFVFNDKLSLALGGAALAIPLNLIAFGILFSPISEIIGIFMNIFSRKNEYEADNFAAKTFSARPLINALKKLSKDNLSNLNPHPAYVFVHYSHPPLLLRLRNLEKQDGGN